MKRNLFLGALLALSLPAVAHAEYSSHYRDIPIKGGLEAAEKEAGAGPTQMQATSMAHDPHFHNATTYTWMDQDYNTITCIMPRDGDADKARCWASYDFLSERYARLTGDRSNVDQPSIFDERPTQKSF